MLKRSARLRRRPLRPLGGEDAGDAGEIVGDADIFPVWRVEKRMHSRKAVVAELKNENAAGFEMRGRLRDETSVDLVALFTAVQRNFGLVVAYLAHE